MRVTQLTRGEGLTMTKHKLFLGYTNLLTKLQIAKNSTVWFQSLDRFIYHFTDEGIVAVNHSSIMMSMGVCVNGVLTQPPLRIECRQSYLSLMD